MKRLVALLLVLALAALCMPALSEGDEDSSVGLVFSGVSSPYMEEGGVPSSTEFFTDADFAASRITIVNLWDSSCLFCRLELPYFQQISVEFSDSGVSCLGAVTTVMGGSYPAAYQYLQEFGVTYPNVIPDDRFSETLFNVSGTPQTFLVNSDGEIVAHHRGSMTYEELYELLTGVMRVPGDADCDGSLTFADISRAYIYLTGGAELTAMGAVNADFNGDGAVSFGDISALYIYVIGG